MLVAEKGSKHTSLVVMGTRPEIIKLGPVYRELCRRPDVTVDAFWTGQHVELADGLMDLFRIEPRYVGSDIMTQPDLSAKSACLLSRLSEILREEVYDSLVVQGDTLSAMIGAIAGFLTRIPVVHVEAGLRTFNLQSPWPEEFSRRLISVASSLHCAPTQAARANLLNEGVADEDIIVSGNTVVDALQFVRGQLGAAYVPRCEAIRALPNDKKLILVTGHRRENFGEPFRNVLAALQQLARDPDKHIIFPVHLNPEVRRAVSVHLTEASSLQLVEPLQYPDFVYLLSRAWAVITDSGGIQEEAPSFDIPVVITRSTTERPEVVEAGFGHLVGCNTEQIIKVVRRLTAGETPQRLARQNPFGTGHAAQKIVATMIDGRTRWTHEDLPAERRRASASVRVSNPY